MSERDGIDISSYQGPPSEWQARAGDIGWAAVKLTELGPGGSRYVNPVAAADWAWLKAHGKMRVAYLFARPASSAVQAAAFFLAELGAVGCTDDDAVAIDLEVSDGNSPAHVASWARQVAELIESALKRKPLVYTFISFAEDGYCAGLERFPLWISAPSYPPGQPKVPWPWEHWALHQHSITGSIDRDIAAFQTMADMAAALGRAHQRPDPSMEEDLPNGILLHPGPTPIRASTLGPWSRLLLSSIPQADKAAPVKLTVSILDGEGRYEQDVDLCWAEPATVHFRHGRAKAISVARTDVGSEPVAWTLL